MDFGWKKNVATVMLKDSTSEDMYFVWVRVMFHNLLLTMVAFWFFFFCYIISTYCHFLHTRRSNCLNRFITKLLSEGIYCYWLLYVKKQSMNLIPDLIDLESFKIIKFSQLRVNIEMCWGWILKCEPPANCMEQSFECPKYNFICVRYWKISRANCIITYRSCNLRNFAFIFSK